MTDKDKPPRTATVTLTTSAPTVTIASSTSTAATALLPIARWSTAPLPPDHKAYSLIGQVASDWSHLEHTLDLIIWALAGIDSIKGACITAQVMGLAPRFRIIITLLNCLNNESATKLADDFDELMRKTFDVAEDRNRIIHDAWYLYTATGGPAQFKSMAFKNPKYGIIPTDLEHIEKTLERIKRRQTSASKLRDAVTALLKTLH
jgi:hypothetical protein